MHAHNWAEDVWENPGRENIYQGSDEILMCQVAAVQEKRMYVSYHMMVSFNIGVEHLERVVSLRIFFLLTLIFWR